jgi:hypothetical protein
MRTKKRGGSKMNDRGPTVIDTGRSSNAGWAVAVIIAVLAVGALLLFTGAININGGGSGGGTDVNVNVPAASNTAPAAEPATSAPAPAADAPAPAK